MAGLEGRGEEREGGASTNRAFRAVGPSERTTGDNLHKTRSSALGARTGE